MPIHDWKNVDANLFHDFHQTWAMEIRNSLNRGLLPKGYFALVEQHAGGVVPDVIALERRSPTKPSLPRPGNVITADPPKTRYVHRAESEILAARGNRIVIHHGLGNIVCVIEIVSPGNKESRHGLASFVDKAVELLRQGVNLLVVDLFPPTARDPQGIHQAIWKEIENKTLEPHEKPLTLVAYVGGPYKTAYVEPVGVGDVLPDMPAFLDPDSYVPVPLEATYAAAWETCPEEMREVIEGGES